MDTFVAVFYCVQIIYLKVDFRKKKTKEHFVGQEKYVPIKKKRMDAEDFATGMLSFYFLGRTSKLRNQWMVRS